MELQLPVGQASRQHQRSPWVRQSEAEKGRQQRPNRRLAQRLLCLPLAGLLTLVLVGCVGRQPSSGPRRLGHRGSSALHNLNRGRTSGQHTPNDHHD